MEDGWHEMDSAPIDGTIVELTIQLTGGTVITPAAWMSHKTPPGWFSLIGEQSCCPLFWRPKIYDWGGKYFWDSSTWQFNNGGNVRNSIPA